MHFWSPLRQVSATAPNSGVLNRIAAVRLHPSCEPHHRSVGSHSVGISDQSPDVRIGLELRQIDCFLAVATDLHFGKAAGRLSLAQSSVSEAIRECLAVVES